MDGELTCINGYYLTELQPDIPRKMLGGMTIGNFWQDYVVLDIETTGLDPNTDKIMELAAIRYSCGKEVERFQTLVNPERSIPHRISDKTGIRQADVENAPRLVDVANDFLQFIGTSPLLGHCIRRFDIPRLSHYLQVEFENPIADTYDIAKRAFPELVNYELDYTLEHLKCIFYLSDGVSHRALADVETANALFLVCMTPWKYTSEVANAYWRLKDCGYNVPPRSPKYGPIKKAPKKHDNSFEYKRVEKGKPSATADPKHPLFGKLLAFTGNLSIPRNEAVRLIRNVGADYKEDVSRKISYLVVGEQDANPVSSNAMSSSEKKARSINESGKAHIEIIGEAEFFALVGGQQHD